MQQHQSTAKSSQEQVTKTPKPERQLSPELKEQLAELEKRLPKAADDFGTDRDQALAYVKEQYEKFAKANEPDIKTQMDALHALIQTDGGFNPLKYKARMEEFKRRTDEEGVGLYPPQIEAVRDSFKAAQRDAAPESDARKSVKALDSAAYPTTFPAHMRQRYSQVLEGIDAVKQQRPTQNR